MQQLELQISEASKSPSSAVEAHTGSSHRPSASSIQDHGEQAVPGRQVASHETTKHVMDYLPLSAMAEPRDRQHMSRGQYSFETFLNAATGASGADVTRSDISNAPLCKKLEDFHKDVIPSGFKLSRSTSDFPVQCYLAMCDVLCPFLDREAFLTKYASISEEIRKGTLQGLTADAPHDLFLVYISIATGTLVAPEYQYRESFAMSLAHEAMRLLPRIMRESDDPSVVQSLIALAIFSLYSPLGGSTWHLVGLALARSMSAGMHTSEVSDFSAADPATRENSRLFWSLYILDATLSSALDRPFCLQDHEITASMPLYAARSPTSHSDTFLTSAVQCAHLLRDTRRKSTMGTVFHLANYAHWKEMNADRVPLPVEPQLKELVSQLVSSMSCKLVLQMVKAAASSQSGGSTHLYATAEIELENLIKAHKRVAESHSRVLTAFDGIDIATICIYMVDRHICTADPARLHTNPTIRACLALCSTISERFSGMKQLLEMLWLFIDLASSNSPDVDGDVLRLTQQHHNSGTSLPGRSFDQMRTILLRRSGSHATAN